MGNFTCVCVIHARHRTAASGRRRRRRRVEFYPESRRKKKTKHYIYLYIHKTVLSIKMKYFLKSRYIVYKYIFIYNKEVFFFYTLSCTIFDLRRVYIRFRRLPIKIKMLLFFSEKSFFFSFFFTHSHRNIR